MATVNASATQRARTVLKLMCHPPTVIPLQLQSVIALQLQAAALQLQAAALQLQAAALLIGRSQQKWKSARKETSRETSGFDMDNNSDILDEVTVGYQLLPRHE